MTSNGTTKEARRRLSASSSCSDDSSVDFMALAAQKFMPSKKSSPSKKKAGEALSISEERRDAAKKSKPKADAPPDTIVVQSPTELRQHSSEKSKPCKACADPTNVGQKCSPSDTNDAKGVKRPTPEKPPPPGGSQKKRAKVDVIDLVDDDNDDSGNKADNQTHFSEKTTSTSPQNTEHAETCSCIKLFATEEDLKTRKAVINGHTLAGDHWSVACCQTLREMLRIDAPPTTTDTGTTSTIDWMVISTFKCDFNFLLQYIPELISIPRVICFYGQADTEPMPWKAHAGDSLDLINLDPSQSPNTTQNPTSQKIPFGTHHSKFFLVGFSDGTLRVVIHTSNIGYGDLFYKTQAAYVEDFALKSANGNAAPDSSPFETDLLDYLDTYSFQEPRVFQPGSPPTFLRHILKRYDFSTATAVLVPSTPGYHKTNLNKQRGHLKLRDCIAQHCRAAPAHESGAPSSSSKEAGPVVLQYSSVGSLSEKYLRDLHSSMRVGAAGNPNNPYSTTSRQRPLSSLIKLVWPTAEDIRHSVEGYRGGGSVPAYNKNVTKPFLQGLYHKWSDNRNNQNPLAKPENVPHIKSYYQLGKDRESMEYFMVASHNLSKAALGEIQNSSVHGGRRLFVRSWELGVFIAPSLLPNCRRLVPYDGRKKRPGDVAVPLPYSLNPQPYSRNDNPWIWDESYTTADRFGLHSLHG